MIIGCDIGGVVKELTTDNPINGAIDAIKNLEQNGHTIIFISKCKKNFQQILSEWLQNNGLINKVYFCEEYKEKCAICVKQNVNYMIDDKLQVFRDIPNTINKIWLCDNINKINGAYKYQPEEVKKVNICSDWNNILCLIN